jgi:hypothetical protein
MIRSQHDLIVPPALETGRYELRLWLQAEGQLLGEPFYLGSIEVTAPAHHFSLPAAATPPVGPPHLAQGVTLAGYSLHRTDQALQIHLYWQTQQPLPIRYKVFTQLLDPANGVVSQSDQVPAAGQRPTSGWLPGEIITDVHHLPLPAAGQSYRLITGLYNPLNGERLPLLEESRESLGDAILVAEVAGP